MFPLGNGLAGRGPPLTALVCIDMARFETEAFVEATETVVTVFYGELDECVAPFTAMRDSPVKERMTLTRTASDKRLQHLVRVYADRKKRSNAIASLPRPAQSSNSTGVAPVAQLDRALPSEGRGQRFESFRARHFIDITIARTRCPAYPAAATKARIKSPSFTPGALSTPEDTSTIFAPVSMIACDTL